MHTPNQRKPFRPAVRTLCFTGTAALVYGSAFANGYGSDNAALYAAEIQPQTYVTGVDSFPAVPASGFSVSGQPLGTSLGTPVGTTAYSRSAFPGQRGIGSILSGVQSALTGQNSIFSGTGYNYVRADLGRLSRTAAYTGANGTAVNFDGKQRYFGGRLGHMFNRSFGIEGRLLFSGSAAESRPTGAISGPLSRYAIKGTGGVFGRYQYDLGNGLIPYANLGIAGTRREFTSVSGTSVLNETDTKFGLGGGLGMEINFASNLVFGIDYFRAPKAVRGLGLSLGYNF